MQIIIALATTPLEAVGVPVMFLAGVLFGMLAYKEKA